MRIILPWNYWVAAGLVLVFGFYPDRVLSKPPTPYSRSPIAEVESREMSASERKSLAYPNAEYSLLDPRQEIEGIRNYIASLLALYPNHKLVFLARDSELVYDIAQTFFTEHSNLFELVNLSRNHLYQFENHGFLPLASLPEIARDYLRELNMLEGKSARIVMADVGLFGSLQNAIEKFSEGSGFPKSHFICSQHPLIPSSISFFETRFPGQTRSSGSLSLLEFLPHTTQVSQVLVKEGNRVVALAEATSPEEVAKAEAVRRHFKYYMEKILKSHPTDAANILAAMEVVRKGMVRASPGKKVSKQAVAEALELLRQKNIRSFPEEVEKAYVLNFGVAPQVMEDAKLEVETPIQPNRLVSVVKNICGFLFRKMGAKKK